MAVPKKKVSKSRRNKRRSHISVENLNIVLNKTTGEPQLQHHVSVDGYYGGKKVIADKVKNQEGDAVAQEEQVKVEAVEEVEATKEVETKKEDKPKSSKAAPKTKKKEPENKV